ncbi:hypothetical protein [Nitrosococcus watsonii]|uniref:hypothetical protein n=1 Tax=Nitrosococcus watsonii TaxID=473531 RepID=UPI0002E69334|nr:hypothetical protein [Nitrosococcus watsonii]
MENLSIAEKIFKAIGLIAVVVSILAIPVSLVSGAGIIISLITLLLSACSALLGNTRYLLTVFVIVTFNLRFVSVLMDIPNLTESILMVQIIIAYTITLIFYAIGVYRRKRRIKS